MKNRTWLLTLLLLVEVACALATTRNCAADDAKESEQTAFVPAGGFDWHRTISRRPVFTVDYWPGVPAVRKEGRPDISSDLEHLKAYADPVTVRTLRGGFSGDEASPEDPSRTGAFVIPNLLQLNDAELRDWQQNLRVKLEPYLDLYRKAGVYTVDIHTFFERFTGDNTPDWFRQSVPDWAECDLSGKTIPYSCLSHPMMYETIDKTFQALAFLRQEPVFLGFHLSNEPHFGHVKNLSDYGGNPHTKKAFREFLRATFGSVEKLNPIGGTSFPSFEAIDIGDRNWLIRVMAARFRSTLVLGVYQTRLAKLAKKHFPQAVTMTRLETGYWLRAQDGKREINGVEFTHLKDSQVDVISWSHSTAGHPHRALGALQATGGLLRGVGKPIGFTEPHVQRYSGTQYGVYRPDELQHLIYRGLFYNFRMFNLHSWDRIGAWAIYNEPFGAVYSKHPGTLRMVAQLRSELERSAPYQTFGKPLMPPLRLLVSRNARHYPGMGGWPYGTWLDRLCSILNTPQYSSYEILEEQTCDVAEALQRCCGVVVSDACLSPRTRELLSDFVGRGGRLLVFGAPATVGSNYEPASLPEAYLVSAQPMSLAKLTEEEIPSPVDCQVKGDHPVLAGLSSVKLFRPVALKLKPGAQVVANSSQGDPVGSATERVVYLAGFPTDSTAQRTLLENFGRWCGVEPPELLISQFENATVVQEWDTTNHRRDGSVINTKPYVGPISMSSTHGGVIQELREDHPWLAYHREADGQIVLEGVRVDPKGVKVFRKEVARELPHFENIPRTVGFEFFWAGQSHPIIGRFTMTEEADVDAQLVGGPWNEGQIGWYVVEIGKQRVAEGKGRQVRFHAEPGKHYYLTAVLANHPGQGVCPLCKQHAFE